MKELWSVNGYPLPHRNCNARLFSSLIDWLSFVSRLGPVRFQLTAANSLSANDQLTNLADLLLTIHQFIRS